MVAPKVSATVPKALQIRGIDSPKRRSGEGRGGNK